MRRLVNAKFQQLRSWLYPGQAGEGSAPTQVAEELVVVVDAEHWVPVPRYMALAVSPIPLITNFASINFEAFTSAGAGSDPFRPQRFMVTDFWVLTVSLFMCLLVCLSLNVFVSVSVSVSISV